MLYISFFFFLCGGKEGVFGIAFTVGVCIICMYVCTIYYLGRYSVFDVGVICGLARRNKKLAVKFPRLPGKSLALVVLSTSRKICREGGRAQQILRCSPVVLVNQQRHGLT